MSGPAETPRLRLNNGTDMPQVGLGVFRVPPDVVGHCVGTALAAGYRLIDTAASYGNEEAVGTAIAESGVPRGELFITTKLWNADQGYSNALRAFERSLARLGLERIDLYLIHWPLPTRDLYIDTWRALERLHDDGLARAIGVSNFEVRHLERLLANANVMPAVDQVEMHPGFPRDDIRELCAAHGIQAEAWSPLGQGRGLLAHPAVVEVAGRRQRSPAQVVLRWHVQRATTVIPKSITASRIAENIRIFDFELDGEDMAALSAIGSGGDRLGPDPETFDVT